MNAWEKYKQDREKRKQEENENFSGSSAWETYKAGRKAEAEQPASSPVRKTMLAAEKDGFQRENLYEDSVGETSPSYEELASMTMQERLARSQLGQQEAAKNMLKDAGYVGERFGLGVATGLEGLADAAILAKAQGILDSPTEKTGKAIADLLGIRKKNTEELMTENLAKQALANQATEPWQVSIEDRYDPNRVAETVGEIGQTIGNMAPSIVGNILLPGIGIPVMGVAAGGQGAQQAYQETADLGKATLYGMATGGLEAGTELLFGGLAGLGKGVADTAVGKVVKKAASALGDSKAGKVISGFANSPVVKAVADSLGEGVEEVIATYLDPFLQRVIYNPNAQNATAEELIQSGLMGMLVGGVFQAGNAALGGLMGEGYVPPEQVEPEINEMDAAPVQTEQDSNAVDTHPEQTHLSNKQVERMIRDEATMREMGIYTNGKTMSQLRAEVRARMAAQEQGAQETSADGNMQTPAEETALRSDSAAFAEAENPVAPQNRAEYNETTRTEGMTNGEEVYLRNGIQRAGSAYPGGEVSTVEESAGRNPSGQTARQIADRGAASLTYGERVSTASLGIGCGSIKNNIRLLKNGDTQHTAEAKRIAKERGLRVYFFSDDNLNIRQSDGKFASARGYISGDRVFIRVDHPLYTADQIMRHEAGHDMIAKGEVDLSEVRRRIKKAAGGRQVRKIAKMYADAYEGAGMTADEIWEEVICDSLGDMNIFSGKIEENEAGTYLTHAKEATQADIVDNRQERGPPDGKMSRDPDERRRALRKGEMVNKFRKSVNWPAYYEKLKADQYNPEYYDDGEIAYMYLDGYMLKLEMQTNGEFSVVDRKKGVYHGQSAKNRRPALGSNGGTEVSGQRDADRGRSDLLGQQSRKDGGGNRAEDRRGKKPEGSGKGGTDVRGVTGKASRDLDVEYMSAVENGDMETAQRMVDETAKAAGYTPVSRYHQTGKRFNKFSNENPDAGLNDSDTPNGYFFKENDHDIGVGADFVKTGHGGNIQMRVFLKHDNLLYFKNRDEARKWYADNVPGYRDLLEKYNKHLSDYEAISKETTHKMFDELIELDASGESTPARENEIIDKYDKILDEWIDANQSYSVGLRAGMRDLLNQYFIENDSGYDGIELADDGHRYIDMKREDVHTFIVFKNTQMKSADPVTYDDNGNVIPLSERFNPENDDIRFSMEPTSEFKRGGEETQSSISDEIREEVRIQLARMGKEYGFIPAGETPYREAQVPRRTERGNKVSQTVRTILEAQATPDEMVPNIEKLVADGKLSYNPISDESAVNEATAIIERDSWDTAQRDWFKAMGKGVVSKANTTMGWLLYNNAANSGNTKLALDILNEMVKSQRSAAQALQATRILKTLSPETQLYGAQKSVEGLTSELKKRYGDDIPDLKIDPALAEKFLNARTDKGRTEAMQEIYRDIGRQMPSRFIDKFNAWRYLAMLGNPRTHVRNIFGNAGFAPVVMLKNLTATGIERMVLRNTEDRTKAIALATKEGRALMKAAWADYANVMDSMPDGKYSDLKNANKYIEEGRVIFGKGEGKTAVGRALSNTLGKATEKVRRFNSGALAQEDMWFSKPYYASALAQYCKAHGITVEELQRGKTKRVGVARNYAMREAQKATYQDTNVFSDWFASQGRKRTNNVVGQAWGTLVEGVLPFRKTPANILVRAVEYSPVGFMKTILIDSNRLPQVDNRFARWAKLKFGELDGPAEFIDLISSGLTGTALLGIGLLLAKLGLVRGHGDDEKDKEEKFSDLQGIQNYALELPDGTSITLDWLAPEALPFFMGVNIWEMATNSKDGVKMGDLLASISNVTEPMLEMSCLSGLNELIESASSISASDGLAAIPKLAVSATTSLLTQVMPTLLGQIERTSESVRMTTYTDKNKFLTPDFQYFLGKVSAKIPGLDYGQIPYIDAWGRTESNGGPFERAMNNFLNPAYMSEVRTSAMEQELNRLYASVGETELLPSRAPKSFTVDGEDIDLTAEQYVEYASFRGQRAYDLLTELTESRRYSGLDDKLKASAVKKCYSVANEEAKALVSEFLLGKFHQSMDKAEAAGISGSDYILFYVAVSELKQDQVRAWLNRSGYTNRQKQVLWSTKYSSSF